MRLREELRALALLAASRVWILVVGWWSWENVPPGPFLPAVTKPFAILLRPFWDETYYLRIAAVGYEPDTPTLAFLPGFPLVLSAVAHLFHIRLFEAARLVANLATAIAFLLFGRLCRRDMTESETTRTLALLAFFPTGIYLSLGYTEPLFLLLVVGTLLASRTRRWLLASLLGYCAALTRANGFLLLVPIFLEYGSTRRSEGRRLLGLPLVAFALVPAGLGTFFLHLYVKTGDLFAHSHIEKSHWNRSIQWVGVAIQNTLTLPQPLSYRVLLLAYPVLPFLAMALAIRQRMRLSYIAFTLVVAALAISIGHFDSTGRFLLVMPPMFMAYGVALRRSTFLFTLLLLGFAALEAVTTVLYFRGYWTT